MISKHLSKTACYLLILTGSILRIVSCFQHNPLEYLFSDPKRHWFNAELLVTPDVMGAFDPILYQIYLAAVRHIVADNAFLLAGTCALLSLIMPWTFYRASREFGMTQIQSLAVWGLIAITPSLFTIYHYFMMETLLLPLVGLSLWLSARHLRKGGRTAFLWSVAIWTLACLTKATVAPLAAICLGWTWWGKSRRISDGLWGAGLAMMLLLPNAIRTYHYLGFPAPLGNPWLTKIQHRSGERIIHIRFGKEERGFSSPSCYMYPLEPLSYWTMRRTWKETVTNVSVDPRKGVYDWKIAYGRLNIGWSEWISQLGENVILFLFAASWPDNNTAEWDGWLASLSRWLWAPLIFFLFDCNIREFIRKRFDLLPVAVTVFALFLMFQNVATAEGRYRKPLEPLLLMNLVWTLSPLPRKKVP